jgi:xylulokinase
MSLLAIDIGSSTCKAVVFATDGASLAQHSFSYVPEFPNPSFAELNPEKFWDAVRCCCRAVNRNLNDPVQALCLSSHGETFVAVDARGRPLTNAVLNQDNRAVEESAWCERVIGRRRLFQITGQGAHPMYPLPKILWLRQHQPNIFAAADCFVSLIGYLLQKMQFAPYVDYSLASRYLAFDICKRSWSDEILSAVGLKEARLPIPVPAGTIVGKLGSDVAAQLGLTAGVPVVLGGHDQPCSALGSGVIGAGRVAHSIGTYECLLAAGDAPSLNDHAFDSALNSYCHVVPDKYVTIGYFPSGIMVKWFHDLLYGDGAGAARVDATIQELEKSHYAFLEARAPAGPTGLFITPHLVGTGNPEFNPHARGVIAGLGPGTDRAQIHKGILEGLACELSILIEVLAESVGGVQDLYVTGGGARSALGLQLRAAVTGCRLHVMKQEEAACLGTAILAGVAIGEYKNAAQAIDALVGEDAMIVPDARTTANYQIQFERYRQFRSQSVQRS